MITWLSWS